MNGFKKFVFMTPSKEKEILKQALVDYCKLDTKAMVLILNNIKNNLFV